MTPSDFVHACIDFICRESVALRFWLYWLPLYACCYRAAALTWRGFKHDVIQRDAKALAPAYAQYYGPTTTIGSIVGWLAQAALPLFNIWFALHFIFGKALPRVLDALDWIANLPLVPRFSERELAQLRAKDAQRRAPIADHGP